MIESYRHRVHTELEQIQRREPSTSPHKLSTSATQFQLKLTCELRSKVQPSYSANGMTVHEAKLAHGLDTNSRVPIDHATQLTHEPSTSEMPDQDVQATGLTPESNTLVCDSGVTN